MPNNKEESSGGGEECGSSQRSYSPEVTPTQNQQTEQGSEMVQQIGTPGQILLCFSALTNLLKICSTRSKESLSCVHGLRVFSLVWVIAGHTCMFAFPFSDNRNFRQVVEKDFLFQSIGNGAFSVDTFFFISGLLVTYVFFKAIYKVNSHHDITQSPEFRSSCMQFLGVFSYRFIRLTPPYMLVLGFTELVTKWFDRNSVFEPPTQDHNNCPQYWWRNVLYINTLFPVNQMCMIWSWYLANDTQFYALAIVLLLLSVRFPRTATVLLVVLVVSSWITTAVIVVNTHHVPSVEEPLGLFDALYDKPWMRLGPYAIGMAVGLLLHHTGCKLHMHKAIVVVGWALSLALTFTLVHGLYGDLDPVSSAAYVALSHSAWALALAWITVACCTGHGGYVDRFLSSPAFQPLSRITYCAYLLHPVLMLAIIMHMDSPVHLARGTMIMTIFGYFVASYLGSLVLSLAVEAPVINLLNLAHPMKRKLK